MDTEFSAVPPDDILPIWNKIAPLFENIINYHNSGSLEEVFTKLVIEKRDLLWMAWERDNIDNILMVVVTRVVDKSFEILGCSGEKRYLWMDYFKVLEDFAKDNNCNRIKIRDGRKGWKKDLAKRNMKITGYTFEKKI
jgi:hypothetical protein